MSGYSRSGHNLDRVLISISLIVLLIVNLNPPFIPSHVQDQTQEQSQEHILEPTLATRSGDNDSLLSSSRATIDTVTEITLPGDSGIDKFPAVAIFNAKLYVAWTSNDPGITSPTVGGCSTEPLRRTRTGRTRTTKVRTGAGTRAAP